MKKLVIISIIALLTAGWSIARAQQFPDEYLGLPGDNLNLYAVMKLFQESETLEGFEKSLNDETILINNLDLNRDNLVDYLMVIDYVDGDVHTVVLRAVLGRNETQDVAVFTVQRFSDGSVQMQLVGDEALYGRNYIIEPIYADNRETPNPGYTGYSGSNRNVSVIRTTTYEVAAWPVIRFIYRPAYVSWRSSWYWDYYPTYWNPWRPFYWHTYYGYHYNWHRHYYAHYHKWNHYRYPQYISFYYTNVRTYSPQVSAKIKQGNYKVTYSRPDLRKQGEVLYARTNSGRNTGTQNISSDGRVRTSASTAVQRSSESAGSATVRRSAATVANRAVTSSAGSQNTDATRRPATTGTNRNVTNAPAGNGTTVTRRETTTVPASTATSSAAGNRTDVSFNSDATKNNRAASGPSVRQNTNTSQRPATTLSTRAVSTTQAAPKATVTRSSSNQSKPAVKSGNSSSRSRTTAAKSSSTATSSSRSQARR